MLGTTPELDVLGDSVENVPLLDPSGRATDLYQRLGHGPAVIYVYGVAECASCSNLRLEFDIIRHEAPGVRPLLVGVGASTSQFAPYFDQVGVKESAVVDQAGALLKSMRVKTIPFAILIDSTRRIVLLDRRSTARASRFPMGRVLKALAQTLRLH
jgi:hypothetical protein